MYNLKHGLVKTLQIFTPSEAVSMCAQLVLENIDNVEKAVNVAQIIDNGSSSLASALLTQTAELESYAPVRPAT